MKTYIGDELSEIKKCFIDLYLNIFADLGFIV